ncbi:hypothetical protein [Moraxella lacunata]|uniref:hypothetical protein n=1 Tax=Moraxella lacunata TaxID=477 RepID=UPI003EE21E38
MLWVWRGTWQGYCQYCQACCHLLLGQAWAWQVWQGLDFLYFDYFGFGLDFGLDFGLSLNLGLNFGLGLGFVVFFARRSCSARLGQMSHAMG